MTSIKKSDGSWFSGRTLIVLACAFCVLLVCALFVIFYVNDYIKSGGFDVSFFLGYQRSLEAAVDPDSAPVSSHTLHPNTGSGMRAVAARRQYGDNPGITFDVCPEQQVLPVQKSPMGPIVLSDDLVLNGEVEWSCNVDELRAFQKEFPGEELPKEEYCSAKRLKNKHEVFQSQPQSMDRQDFSNGFIGSLMQAYSGHHHVQLRPDDFWLAVVRGFDTLMLEGGPKGEGIAEEVRDSLVEHKGKVKLVVRSGGTIRTGDVDWIVEQFAKQIDNKTKADVRSWIEPNFSTTTLLDRAVSKMALMSTMQRYFDYKAVFLCSLPRVTLLGTADDWKLVRYKVDGLLRFDHEVLTKWHGVLSKVADQFEMAARGEIDPVFWQSVHDWRGRSKYDAPFCGSGSCPIDGWVAVFAPLQALHGVSEKHPFGLVEPQDFHTGWFEVPVEVDDNGVQYETWMRAGHFGENVSGDNHEIISPAVGWQWINQKPRPCAGAAEYA